MYKEHQKKFPNVIKAYYCTYIPDPKKPFSWVLQEQNRWLLRKEQEEKEKAARERERQGEGESNESKRKREEEDVRKSAAIGAVGAGLGGSSSSSGGSSGGSGVEKKHRLDSNSGTGGGISGGGGSISGGGGTSTGGEEEKELWESKKYPGKFYMLDANNAPVWIEFVSGGSGGGGTGGGGTGGAVGVEGGPVRGALFVDPRCNHVTYRASKITTLALKQ